VNFKELTHKILRIVYTLGKWALGIFALAMFVTVAFSLYQQSQYKNSIENGMTRAEVVAELGEPRLEMEELGICTNDAWQGDCEAARQSGAVIYLLWKYGIDTYFIIGLDAKDRVVFHDMGDA
jgi:hypothetical protein